MALQKRVIDYLGRDVELYVRINSAEVSNHGVPGSFLFRGYESKDSFLSGGRYLWEESVDVEVDISSAIWPQAYDAIRSEGDLDC